MNRINPELKYSFLLVPFTTARLSHSEFTYRFPVSPGQKFIRLYFFAASYNADFDSSKSLFSVKAGGYTLLKDFNASLSSASYDGSETLFREYCVNFEPEDRSLNITFTPSKDGYAFINGVEIMSMPTNLYYSAAQGDGASYLGNSGTGYYVQNDTAMEMIYRINVGGGPLSPNEDTGMYRTWQAADDLYLDNISSSLSFVEPPNNIHLNFASIPNYSAPEAVYRTGRTMGSNQTSNKSFNLTWGFPVDPQFSYLVRLHFCEVDPDITEPRNRMFQIFIANLTAELHADIIRWTIENGKGNGIPIYKDYFVPMGSLATRKKGLGKLFVELQANKDDTEKILFDSPLLNGLEIFRLNDTDGNLSGPFPEQTLDIPQKVTSESSRNSTPMLAILAGVVLALLVLSFVGFLVFRRGRKVKDSNSSHRMSTSTMTLRSPFPSYLCHDFSLAEIKAATKNFDDTLIVGVGGFGHVYKGYFDNGATLVAIKRLKATSLQGAHEFMTEIKMLSRLRHRHLVSLIGFCADQGEMILVYDYMARGTLSDHLHRTKEPHLPWKLRLQICIGAAQGLHYLHTSTEGTIIHRDVKSANILLDEKWVAKVSDFGLSKKGIITISKTHISTKVKGSFGYLDPDYYRRQQLTEKSDVYSFGVVLCEVLCGRPAVTVVDNNRVGLAGWVKKCHHEGKLDQVFDPNLKGEIALRCLHRFVSIAISCMDDNGINRPSMDNVVRGLQFALEMQQNNENYIDHIERTVQDEIGLIKHNEGSSSSKQSNGAKESIQWLTGTIFSEIINPVGR
ncbi:putative protein kinase RLK-Pelle-CrRLK1L-1 family [Rosa chinensis]|uniref:Protein kinase domain-containing protein n=1 Tax=Rosa chinensis TaxID=74649 RepID=A0A2P6S3L2_ROSCH|nr:putative protein kinase RLK-Pelle-CrRLK1L-1 family [Rosa chinensis]